MKKIATENGVTEAVRLIESVMEEVQVNDHSDNRCITYR